MTEPAPNIIEIRHLAKTYDILPVLKPLDLDIPRGQFVALLGPNGSGKTTLLRLIAGLIKPSAGTITIGGWQIPQETEAVRAQIGMVSHKPLLYDNLTARENLRFFARMYNLPHTTLMPRIELLLKRVGLIKRADTLVRTFSRGMLQRLSIARALMHGPHVLLFDEPHTGLDRDAMQVLDTMLLEAHQEGHTIIMTTHHLDSAALLAERAVIIYRGGIVCDTPTAPNLPQTYANVTGGLQ